MNTEDYTPYGPEWEAAMMKTNKKTMVIVMRMALQERDNEITSLKNWLQEREQSMKRMEEEIKEKEAQLITIKQTESK